MSHITVQDRITEYLLHGGLWNPELMEHDKVRQLLMDCREQLDAAIVRSDGPLTSSWVCNACHAVSVLGPSPIQHYANCRMVAGAVREGRSMRKPEHPFVAQENTEASWATVEKLREQLDAAQQQIATLTTRIKELERPIKMGDGGKSWGEGCR